MLDAGAKNNDRRVALDAEGKTSGKETVRGGSDDSVTKAVLANVVPSKGTSHAYAKRALAANTTLLGHNCLKTQRDQKTATPGARNKARQHTDRASGRREPRERRGRDLAPHDDP